MNGKTPLLSLLSALIGVPNVELQSRVQGEVMNFAGTIVGLRYGKDTEPFIQIEGTSGQRYFVGMDELEIRVNRHGRSSVAAEPRTTATAHCLAVRDGSVCRQPKGHKSPHDWETYRLDTTGLR